MSLSKEIFAVMAAHRAHLFERKEFVEEQQRKYQAFADKHRRAGHSAVAEIFEKTFVTYCREDLANTEKLLTALGSMQTMVLELTQAFDDAEEAAYAG